MKNKISLAQASKKRPGFLTYLTHQPPHVCQTNAGINLRKAESAFPE
jgi:hypothetical protein